MRRQLLPVLQRKDVKKFSSFDKFCLGIALE
jgi:hypothetical protein